MLTILVPVFEEKNNITNFVNKIFNTLKDIKFYILFVDDNSQDGSVKELEDICSKYSNIDFISRKDKFRDLTESIKLGVLNVKSDLICVTDCDLQHDINKIPQMLDKILNEEFDLVIGSRFLNNNNNIGLSFRRKISSKLGILLSKIVGINYLSDPLSGFFIIKTKLIKKAVKNIDSKGFKILLSILFLLKNKIKIFEIETDFFFREKGKSKLNIKIKILFIKQLIQIFFKRIKKNGSGGGI